MDYKTERTVKVEIPMISEKMTWTMPHYWIYKRDLSLEVAFEVGKRKSEERANPLITSE